jgi:hypothetical protein
MIASMTGDQTRARAAFHAFTQIERRQIIEGVYNNRRAADWA